MNCPNKELTYKSPKFESSAAITRSGHLRLTGFPIPVERAP